MIAFAPRPAKEEVRDIASLLWASIHSETNISDKEKLIHLPQYLDAETNVFETGENYLPVKKRKASVIREINVESMSSVSYDNRINLLLKNKYYFSDTGQRDYGTLMHEIISKVQTSNDIDSAVEEYYIDGDITADKKSEVINILNSYLSNPLVLSWYSGEYRVLNEVQILQPKGTFVRPDRVMIKGGEVVVIDYKFGEKEDKKYIRQVKYYVDQIRKIGYSDIKGYICYITLGKVVEV